MNAATSRQRFWAPGLLFGLALILRLAAAWGWRFDGLYGQDAFAYYRQALAIAANLPRGQLPPLDFFWPNGYPLATGVAMWLLGSGPLAGQAISILAGAALAPLAYFLCRDLFPAAPGAGIVAGLILAVAGQPLLSSILIMADITALFWALLAAWLLVRAWSEPGTWETAALAGAGMALALAAVTRWLYLLLAPVFVAYALYQTYTRKTSWSRLLLPALAGFLVLLPQVWLSLYRPEGLMHQWLLGWKPANAWRREFDTADGHALYRLPVAVFYAQVAGHPAYLFPLFGLAAAWGVWRLFRRRLWGPLILLGGWGMATWLFLAGIPYQNFRFLLTPYPPFVLLAGYGVADLWPRPTAARKTRPRLVALLVALSILAMAAWAYRMTRDFIRIQNRDKLVAHQIAQALPPGAALLAFNLTSTLQHCTTIPTYELYYLDLPALEAFLQQHPTTFLALNPANIEQQWAAGGQVNRPPARPFRWLREHSCLVETGRYPPWVLYEIRARSQC